MPLWLVSTPIGHPDDITLRAIDVLRRAPVIIGEERKPLLQLLRRLEIDPASKNIYFLNEHSKPDDVSSLLPLCREHEVALVSDCGTPAFCDPGAALASACYKAGISVNVCPGPSSLMAFLALSGEILHSFWFEGFLPADREARNTRLAFLAEQHQHQRLDGALVLMDTPYRLSALLESIVAVFGDQQIVVLGLSLTEDTQSLRRGPVGHIAKTLQSENRGKEPFVLMIPSRSVHHHTHSHREKRR